MSAAERQRHGERAPLSHDARRGERSPMELHELARERESDAGSLVSACFAPFDPMETLEHVRDLYGNDPHARVADRELRPAARVAQPDLDAPLERELEGVRKEIEDDLLPHVAVHVDG